MDWELSNAELKRLRRIAAFLYSLANLADQSCRRSAAVRVALLWILHFAEAVAHDFVLGTQPAIRPHDDSIFESRRLANSLRALAVELELQIEDARLLAAWVAAHDAKRVWRLRLRLAQADLLSPGSLTGSAAPALAPSFDSLMPAFPAPEPPYIDTS